MADHRLRRLKRERLVGGTIHDEALVVIERLRAGELDAERVRLAAWLGHGPAALALGVVPFAVGNDPACFHDWLAGFAHVGRQSWVRAALAAAGCVEEELRRVGRAQTRDMRVELVLARAWACCPCPDHFERARSAPSRNRSGSDREDAVTVARGVTAACLRAVISPNPLGEATRALQTALSALAEVAAEVRSRSCARQWSARRRGRRVLRAREAHGYARLARLVDAVRDGLTPWLLAERDALAEAPAPPGRQLSPGGPSYLADG